MNVSASRCCLILIFGSADSIPYCKNDQKSSCDNIDKAQFQMTDLKLRKGKISNPYSWDRDNTYRISGEDTDIDGAFLKLIRRQSKISHNTDIEYDLTIEDGERNPQKAALATSFQVRPDSRHAPPLDPLNKNEEFYADLEFNSHFGLDSEGSVFDKPMWFSHGEFYWKSNTQGVDENAPLFGIGTKKKVYCEEKDKTTDAQRVKEMNCYFPTRRVPRKD